MNLLPFGQLPPHTPRQFLPAHLDLGDWSQIEPHFHALELHAHAAVTLAGLENWLLHWSELTAALDEESSRRYIAMTCHTDSPEAESAYLQFVEQIEPQLKPRQFKLSEIYLAHPLRPQLPQPRYHIFDRDTQLHVELFRPENIPLETDETRLGQQYQKLTGSLTVHFRGQETTLTQMGRHLEETDRPLRQEAWQLIAQRRLQEVETIETTFDQLLHLRASIATHAGFPDYLTYAFRARGRFDYTPDDCLQFHHAIELHVVPALRALHAHRRAQLQLPSLRPWDLAVDPLGRPPLRPFLHVDQMIHRTQDIFHHLDGTLARGFQTLRDLHLLDLDNRKGKAPGGYQATLAEARLPFIFMNAVGQQHDIETMLHEAGHAFHALATREEPLHHYRHAPIEFCEVASMTMELLGNEHLHTFYPPDEARRARQNHLQAILTLLPWIATIDAFQHWLYTHPAHTRAQRTDAWVALIHRFGGDIDWTGHEPARAHSWHRQLHIFLHPFYYIEYAIAQLGALQIWANSKHDHPQALRHYHQALALGGSRPLPELFAAAGCRFALDAATLQPLIHLVQTELAKLDQ